MSLRVVQLSYAFDRGLGSAEELVDRYETLPAWSQALLEAGALQADVVQRFGSDADVARGRVALHLRRAGTGARPRPWTPLQRLHGAVRDLTPDVVHVNGLVHPWGLRALRRMLPPSTALVLQDHSAIGPPRDALRLWLWRRAFAAADAFLFTAASHADAWRRARLVAAEQDVHLVPEASRRIARVPRDIARRQTGISGEPALLWVGRLHEVKDPLTVLDGLEQALDALPRAHLTMIFGSDELLDAVSARCARDGLRQRVSMVGQVQPDLLAAYYASADAFVLGSRREGTGFALLEALASGLPAVVTDIPSFRALSDDGRHARLWKVGDAGACAAALRGLAHADLKVVGGAAREYFERELCWPAVGARAMRAYRSTFEARAQRSRR